MCVAGREEGQEYLVEHASLNQPAKVYNDICVLVLPEAIIKLEIQGSGQPFFSTALLFGLESPVQRFDGPVGGSPAMSSSARYTDGPTPCTMHTCVWK